MTQLEKRIKDKIDEIRPFIINDGGDINFSYFKNGTVYVKVFGSCKKCIFINETIKSQVEKILKKEIKEVKEVKLDE